MRNTKRAFLNQKQNLCFAKQKNIRRFDKTNLQFSNKRTYRKKIIYNCITR